MYSKLNEKKIINFIINLWKTTFLIKIELVRRVLSHFWEFSRKVVLNRYFSFSYKIEWKKDNKNFYSKLNEKKKSTYWFLIHRDWIDFKKKTKMLINIKKTTVSSISIISHIPHPGRQTFLEKVVLNGKFSFQSSF